MVTREQLAIARLAADELRRRGEAERAQAIDALVEAATSTGPATVATDDDEDAADIVGIDGQTLRRWLREGRYHAYRVGPLRIPVTVVEEYVRRARGSLDLEAISDEDAAHLVADGRQRA
jgi:hypothetical protein